MSIAIVGMFVIVGEGEEEGAGIAEVAVIDCAPALVSVTSDESASIEGGDEDGRSLSVAKSVESCGGVAISTSAVAEAPILGGGTAPIIDLLHLSFVEEEGVLEGGVGIGAHGEDFQFANGGAISSAEVILAG